MVKFELRFYEYHQLNFTDSLSPEAYYESDHIGLSFD